MTKHLTVILTSKGSMGETTRGKDVTRKAEVAVYVIKQGSTPYNVNRIRQLGGRG